MRALLTTLLTGLLLTGCGDALEDVPRLSDVPVAEESGQAAALEGEAVTTPEPALTQPEPRRGLLGFLNRRAEEAIAEDAPADTDDAAAPALEQAAPSGEATAPVDLEQAAAPLPEQTETSQPSTKEAPTQRGLFGFLGRRDEAAEAPAAPAPTPAEPPEPAPPAAQAEASEPTPEPDAEPGRARRGLFGLARASEPGPKTKDEDIQLAALPPQTKTDEASPRRGLFGGGARASRGPAPGAPDYEQVGPGLTLPYGKIARLCGAPQSVLGRKVDKAPARGRGFTLHDSKPGTTAAHTYFLTGFDDGCARQFTAALVLFSTPETYEQFRFGPSGRNMRLSQTDAAYDALKKRVCGASTAKPCGAKISQLNRSTVFVSVYERIGSNTKWKTILLHDGKVLAMDLKS